MKGARRVKPRIKIVWQKEADEYKLELLEDILAELKKLNNKTF